MIDLDAIEARVNAASEGPWESKLGPHAIPEVRCPTHDVAFTFYGEDDGENRNADADAAFIAAARTDVPALVAEVRRLRAIIEGRETAPTVKEARAHSHKTGGAFVVKLGDSNAHCCSRVVTGLQRFADASQRWIALDANGRPCAWPEVKP